jgi:DNA-binding FrmR family transcriptional regulator
MSEKDDILSRLKKIEGQIRGIHRIISEDRSCSDIITQLLAAGKALDKVTLIVASRSIKDCILKDAESGENVEKKLDASVSLLLNLAKKGD